MKPRKGSNFLRKGRASIKNQHYLITTAVVDRKPVLNQAGAAKIVLESLHWLEDQGKILKVHSGNVIIMIMLFGRMRIL
jgi:hypothetical protein